MTFYIILALAAVVTLIVGFAIGWKFKSERLKDFIAEAQAQAQKIIENAELEGETLKKEKVIAGQDELYEKRQALEKEIKQQKSEVNRYEEEIAEREVQLERKSDLITKKEKNLEELTVTLNEKEEVIVNKETRLQRLIDEQNENLEKIAGLTREKARQMLLDNLISAVKKEAAQTLHEIREEASQNANRKAKEIIVSAIQESAADHSVETTVSIVKLPTDDMKGRIIGREGRNIRAFEITTGIDVIVDDTPEIVILSGFDPIRREVAKLSLEKLIADGRIHPARIEDVVTKTREEFEDLLLESGEEVLMDLNLSGFSNEIIKLIGKMKYFTSYGQNILQHSIEVAKLSSLMAAELGLETNLAKRAGLLHDIGKVVQGRIDDDHMEVGRELLKKNNGNPIVINAVESHHVGEKPISLIAALVNAADSISLSRPGARKESLEGYIKRLNKLEGIALDFEGVDRAFAIQAGREIRVMVDFEKVDDVMSQQLARDIAGRLEKELEYPGQIKIMLIREYRAAGKAVQDRPDQAIFFWKPCLQGHRADPERASCP